MDERCHLKKYLVLLWLANCGLFWSTKASPQIFQRERRWCSSVLCWLEEHSHNELQTRSLKHSWTILLICSYHQVPCAIAFFDDSFCNCWLHLFPHNDLAWPKSQEHYELYAVTRCLARIIVMYPCMEIKLVSVWPPRIDSQVQTPAVWDVRSTRLGNEPLVETWKSEWMIKGCGQWMEWTVREKWQCVYCYTQHSEILQLLDQVVFLHKRLPIIDVHALLRVESAQATHTGRLWRQCNNNGLLYKKTTTTKTKKVTS